MKLPLQANHIKAKKQKLNETDMFLNINTQKFFRDNLLDPSLGAGYCGSITTAE